MANKKFQVPVNLVNLASDPASASEGDIYYNTTSDEVKVYANGSWVAIGSGGGSASDSFKTISVTGQDSVVADSSTDTLSLIAGTNVSITTNATSDSITINSAGAYTSVDSITYPDYITFDITPETEPSDTGSLWWNTDFETLNLQLDAGVSLQIGQEHLIRVKNNSGSVAIPKGAVVMFAGATGDTVTASPAVSTSSSEPELLIGVTAEVIPADGFGFVTQFGFINGTDTETPGWSLGDLLYVDPANPGVLTDVKPSAPNWTFPVAAVTRVHASTGRILVRAIPGKHLHDVVDVAIDSPADNEVLAYNSGSGVWINQTSVEAGLIDTSSTAQTKSGDLTITGNLTVNGTTTTINSTTLTVDDKNIELGSVASPTNTTADGGGITLKGDTDKTFNWVNSTSAWTSSEHISLGTGKNLLLNGATSGAITITPTAISGTNTITIPAATGTLALTNNKLSNFASTTSAELASVISDETGTGLIVFNTSPTFTTSINGNTGTFTAFATPTTLNFGSSATLLRIGHTDTEVTSTTNISNADLKGGYTKTINIASENNGGIQNINIGQDVSSTGTTNLNLGGTVSIRSGTINGTSIGASSSSTGRFTSVNVNGQAIIEGATGTSSATSSFNTTVYSSAEYIVYASTASGNYVSKVLMLARGTAEPVITEYAILTQGTAPTVTITPSYSAPNAVLTVAVTSGTNIEIIATEVSI
jgi:hypothetical protein